MGYVQNVKDNNQINSSNQKIMEQQIQTTFKNSPTTT